MIKQNKNIIGRTKVLSKDLQSFSGIQQSQILNWESDFVCMNIKSCKDCMLTGITI